MNAAQIRQGQSTLSRSSLRRARCATGATILSRCFENQSASVDGAGSTAHGRRRTIDGARSTALSRRRRVDGAGSTRSVDGAGSTRSVDGARSTAHDRPWAARAVPGALRRRPRGVCGGEPAGRARSASCFDAGSGVCPSQVGGRDDSERELWPEAGARGVGSDDATERRHGSFCNAGCTSAALARRLASAVARRSNAWLAERQHALDGHERAAA